ncbi:MAG: glycoside hydrolase family 3 C-terminal domain-containing protein [Defluviitaleaceae bacterium]|nr:glycoside hydrolase family 3 C-terminal domain-containing protein [Defluviitaleaceae bacterium]
MDEQNLLAQDTHNDSVQVLGSRELAEDYKALCRKAAGEGIVLLKNDGVLPLNDNISVFGRVQHDYFYVGYGSGGDVIPPYRISLMDGISAMSAKKGASYNKELCEIYRKWCGENVPETGEWGKWPTNFAEMPLTAELVKNAAAVSDTAVVVIGRSAGEDRDSLLEEGSFFLTKQELQMLDLVTAAFSKVVVLINSGNIIDFSWLEKYESKINALLYVWQGGMESGNAVADALYGEISPSGKLTTTIAKRYENYPTYENFGAEEFNNYVEDIYVGYRYFETFAKNDVLFPFGFGLSYADFAISAENPVEKDGNVNISVKVANNGKFAGKEVVQVYYAAPQGLLGKPSLALAAFQKTEILAPQQQTTLEISFAAASMASYDDGGKTGNKSAYVLEPGEYGIFVGQCVRSAKKIGVVTVDKLQVVEQLQEVAAPVAAFDRLIPDATTPQADGTFAKKYEPVPLRTVNLKERIIAQLPQEIPQTGDKGYKLVDVAAGKVSLEDFIAQLTAEELEGLTRGDYIMNSPLGVLGNAGVFGGTTQALRDYGVAPVTACDGPSGIRLRYYCALLPCATALAATWNTQLVKELATKNGAEIADKKAHVLLAPGLQVMRAVLCGRNFEYFSEDPLLVGKIGAAVVVGLQSQGVAGCPKHFACNDQETFRIKNDSRLSERALREIHLKGFEICVKESNPRTVMSSYNKINGVYGHYHHELCTTVLRGEWQFAGLVMTDWWMRPGIDPDFPAVFNDAYRVRAQVDLLMPGGKSFFATEGDGSLLESHGKEGGISLAEMQRTAGHVLRFVLAAG